MAIVYRLQKGASLSYAEMDGNFSYLNDATLASVTGSSIDGVTQTFKLGNGTSYTNTIASASYSVSSSYSVTSSHNIITTATNAETASFVTGSNVVGIVASASYALTASSLTGTIESASYAISASHVEFADDATSSSYAVTSSHAVSSISASYALTASHALNSSGGGEWDGTRNGDAEITGSLVVTSNITGSNISASGNVYTGDLFVSDIRGNNSLGVTFTVGTPLTASSGIQVLDDNITITKASTTSDEEIRIGTDNQDNVVLKGGQIIVDDSSTGAIIDLKNRLANSTTRPTLGQIEFFGKDSDIGSGLKGQIRGKFTGGSKQEMAMEFYSTASGALNTFQDADIDLRLSSGSSIELFRDTSLTGSFSVSGSSASVNLLDAGNGVSGSFSGSFYGDGSGLTNLPGINFDSDWYDGTTYVSSSREVRVTGNISGSSAILIGILHNKPTYGCSSIAGGLCNSADGIISFVGGGGNNYAGNYAFVGGGLRNSGSGQTSTIAGGESNCASNQKAFVGGGSFNTSSGAWSTVGGGTRNQATTSYTTIGGGICNQALGGCAFVGGGSTNCTSVGATRGSAIVAGCDNKVLGDSSFIGGGACNCVTGNCAVIVGGRANTTIGNCSGILGGQDNNITHQESFIVGSKITSERCCTTYVNNIYVTGSATSNAILTLATRCTTPIPLTPGDIWNSGSIGAGCLYFSPNGSAICKISFV